MGEEMFNFRFSDLKDFLLVSLINTFDSYFQDIILLISYVKVTINMCCTVLHTNRGKVTNGKK